MTVQKSYSKIEIMHFRIKAKHYIETGLEIKHECLYSAAPSKKRIQPSV